jgi:hypothetical protein
MKLAFFAAAAVIAVPFSVRVADGQTPPPASEKCYCDVNQPTGSRLGAVRRCRTKSERDAAKQEARNTVDRIQVMKPTLCGPGTSMPC